MQSLNITSIRITPLDILYILKQAGKLLSEAIYISHVACNCGSSTPSHGTWLPRISNVLYMLRDDGVGGLRDRERGRESERR